MGRLPQLLHHLVDAPDRLVQVVPRHHEEFPEYLGFVLEGLYVPYAHLQKVVHVLQVFEEYLLVRLLIVLVDHQRPHYELRRYHDKIMVCAGIRPIKYGYISWD